MKCKGGEECGEKKYSERSCRHASEIKDGKYDHYLCHKYWEILQFE
jgi:hypothetical protein